MIRFKFYLLTVIFFVLGSGIANAQADLRLKIDSITYDGLVSTNDTALIYKNDISLSVHCHLFNDSIPSLLLPNSNFRFVAQIDSIDTLDSNNFTYSLSSDTLLQNENVAIVFKILNPNGSPLPHLLPGGSSVVIWPVYFSNTYTAAHFILLADTNTTTINDLFPLYNFIGANHQTLFIQFTTAEYRTVELYDATGRKAYEHQSSTTNDEIAWGALPAAAYILRIQQGQQSVSVKLLRY